MVNPSGHPHHTPGQRPRRAHLGLDLDELLQRPPTDRELGRLGERRDGYGVIVGRDPKTLGRWSDRAIADLRSHLLADTFTGHLYVVGAVKDGQLLGISLIREELDQQPPIQRTTLDCPNPTRSGPSLPCLLYAYPRDWRPASLTLSVSFVDDPPKSAWGISAESFMDLSFGHERHELAIGEAQATCRFERPRRDRIYGLWWR